MHFSSPVLTHSAYHTWRGSQPYSFKTSTWLCTARTRRQVSQRLRSLVRAAVCLVRDRWLPCQARTAFSPPKSSLFNVCLATNRQTLCYSRRGFNPLLSRINPILQYHYHLSVQKTKGRMVFLLLVAQIQIEEAVIADQLCRSSRLRLTLGESSAIQTKLPANALHTDPMKIIIIIFVF